MTSFLSGQTIDPQAVAARVGGADHGAVVLFVGTVRDRHNGRAVRGLTYSAYEPMAELVAAHIVRDACSQWPALVAVEHRVGALAVGDVAIVVAVSAEHRGAAFAACEWLVDAIKARVPIWKRERYADGQEAWVDPTSFSAETPA
ncbi:MAG TPA: molybdenum cofactor biosynthesis protein MoaE [Gemmatimonadales bacterium]|jgi:molybdopterin synthase catalytic subunit